MIDFKLDPKTGTPFYRQIIDQIRFGIAAGKLKAGEQLPTVRSLAVDLQINLNTVAKAYRELEIQRVLETQQGSGTFISEVRSEEHTSELQSLMRISYAVFCLKKKTKNRLIRPTNNIST